MGIMKLTLKQIQENVIALYKQSCDPEHLNDDPNIHICLSDEEQLVVNSLYACRDVNELLEILEDNGFEDDRGSTYYFIVEACMEPD